MRKIVLNLAISLDGYISEIDGDFVGLEVMELMNWIRINSLQCLNLLRISI